MRSRPDLLAVTLLTVLAAGVTSTSATLALRDSDGATTAGPAARLPDVLFSPEPPGPVAPVRLDIAAGHQTDDAVGLVAPSPPAQPSPQARSTKAARAAAPPAAVPKLTVTLGFVESQAQGRDSLTYTATLRNEGPEPLQGLVLSAHVPAGTRWRADAPCRGESRPLSLGYGDGSPVVVCVPVPRGWTGGDSSSHEVVAVFDRPIPPGGTATASYSVRVERAVGSVENHVHVEGPGIHAVTPPLVTKVL
jgi:uncharacterized repeat protein (TIGR01451 family)